MVEVTTGDVAGLHAPEPATQDRFAGFDALRALAATLIVLHHVGFTSGATLTQWFGAFLGRMDIGVPIFFVISGYLLYRPFVAAHLEGRPLPGTASFWWRRGLRIFPAYWTALVIQLVFGGIIVGGTVGFLWAFGLVHVYDVWNPIRAVTGITQSWSLATELAFYLVLPFWARWVAARTRAAGALLALGGWFAVSLGFRVVVHTIGPSWADNSWLWLPALADLFAIGMALAVVSVWAERSNAWSAVTGAVGRRIGTCWLLAAGVFWFVATQLDLPYGLARSSLPLELVRQTLYAVVALLLVAPVAFASVRRSWLWRILNHRALVLLGVLSYGIYLWHQFFIHWVREWLDWGIFSGHFAVTFLLAYGLSIVAAYLSYRLVEQPASRLRQWVKTRRMTVASRLRERPVAAAGAVERDAPWPPRRFTPGLVAIAAVGLGVRVAYVLIERRGIPLGGDPYFYHQTANLLGDGNGFISPYSLRVGARVQAADHPPLFAVYLAMFSVIGVRSELGHELATCVLGVATIVLTGLIARRLAGPGVGLLAAALVAVYPNSFTYDGAVLSEALVTPLVLAAVLLALHTIERPSPRRAAVLGVVVGLAALTRAEQVLLLPVLAVPVFAIARVGWRRTIRFSAIAAVAAVIVIAPWTLYNASRFEHPILLSSQGEITLAAANCDTTYHEPLLGYWDMRCVQDIAAAHGKDQLLDDQSTLSSIYRNAAIDYVRGHASRLPVVLAARVGRAIGVYDPSGQFNIDQVIEGREKWNVRAGYAMYVILAILSVAGLWSLRKRLELLWPALAPIIVVLVTVAAFYASSRFRAPIEPVVCIAAAIGVARLGAFVRELRSESRERRVVKPEPSLAGAHS